MMHSPVGDEYCAMTGNSAAVPPALERPSSVGGAMRKAGGDVAVANSVANQVRPSTPSVFDPPADESSDDQTQASPNALFSLLGEELAGELAGAFVERGRGSRKENRGGIRKAQHATKRATTASSVVRFSPAHAANMHAQPRLA